MIRPKAHSQSELETAASALRFSHPTLPPFVS